MATWLLRDSKDLRLVKEVLGHKNIQTTLKYAHLINDRKAEGLNNLFKK
jgi:site-specific recombinase XerD